VEGAGRGDWAGGATSGAGGAPSAALQPRSDEGSEVPAAAADACEHAPDKTLGCVGGSAAGSRADSAAGAVQGWALLFVAGLAVCLGVGVRLCGMRRVMGGQGGKLREIVKARKRHTEDELIERQPLGLAATSDEWIMYCDRTGRPYWSDGRGTSTWDKPVGSPGRCASAHPRSHS